MNILLLSLALSHLLLLGWSFQWSGVDSWRLWFLRAMLCAMFYDNLMQGVGVYLVDSEWFEAASRLRYLLHVTVLPFLALFSLSILRQAEINWADKRWLTAFVVCFFVSAQAYGIYHEVYLLELGPKTELGIVKMANLSGRPPLATIAINLLVLPLAAALWYCNGWRWFFLSALFIFLVNGSTATQPWGFVAGNFAELVFVVGLLFTERQFSRGTAKNKA